MCDICNSSECLIGCPNRPEAEPVYRCSNCKSGICEDDNYIENDITGEKICMGCIEDMTVYELLEILDIEIRSA